MRSRRHGSNGLEAWPGYVDALSTLLMVIIFVLLVFVLAQAFLSVVLSGRDKALDQVKQQLAQLTDALSLERGHSAELQTSVAQLSQQLAASSKARDTLSQQLADAAVAGAATDRAARRAADPGAATRRPARDSRASSSASPTRSLPTRSSSLPTRSSSLPT